MTIKELTKFVMKQAKEKGFGVTPEEINISAKIASLHSEVSEVYEASGMDMDLKENIRFKQELGDVVQRVLHLCGVFDIDIEKEILEKIEKNKNRTWLSTDN